ncbi:Eco57I restriction-modification methylase domain-containing protein [Deinococcus antarcticus]|uniref:site-specific DNA-methyltransferase (adenine-specific) n=1 Tax=Deinococcus antarcticus TaxID=1298767 RepID=A0ABV8ACG0_9DEIO
MTHANATLQLDALTTTRTLGGISALYQQLGYATDAEPESFTAEEIGLEGAAADDIHRAVLLTDNEDASGSLQHWHFELQGKLSTFTVRRVAEQFVRRPGDYLLSFSERGGTYPSVQFVKPRKEVQEGGKTIVRLSKLTVTPAHPTAHDRSILQAIAVRPGQSAADMHKRQLEAFSVERVTKQFYKTYHDLFKHVLGVIREQNPGAIIQSGPERRIPAVGAEATDDERRALHAFTQRLLGRLLFLYFIQKKGWLEGREHYITELYENTVQAGGNFYRDALEPLYFETLNTPVISGTERGIPYLNGSLFEREYPDTTVLNLPNSLFDPRNAGNGAGDPGGILHVLNSFNFTVGESAALEQDISLDPEMLGKVFENLMEEDEAAKSGTFYTPRSIVQFMAEETLTRYLHDHTGISQERLLNLVADDSEAHDLSNAEAKQIIEALAQVRVLDPAVGTASMLVGFLNAMIRVRRSAEAKRGNHVTPGSPALADWKREYIQNCLYGVDIKHEAIEIARLRLWLSLVVDATDPEPLPNLDYKLMAGDGLLETVDGEPFIKTQSMFVGGQGDVTAKADQIGKLHEKFFHEQDHARKRELRAEIQQRERELFKLDVDDRIKNLDLELTALNRQLADGRQSDAAKNKLLKRHAALYENLEALMLQRRKVWDDKEPLPFFLHNVHFSEVMKGRGGNGGFDIVIGNPPYVRHERLGKDQKAALQNAFPDVATGTADLYVYFYQKGLNLLRDGGRLAYITPNKFMRAGYGAKLRDHLSRNTKLELLADFGDLPVFDATTYPLIAIFQKAKPDAQPVQMLPERTLKAHLADKLEGGVPAVREGLNAFHLNARELLKPLDRGALTGSEWTLDDPRVLKLMEKLRAAGRPLGEVVEGKFYYGIKTGFNEAFVIDEAKRAELITADPRSAEVIKPFLRGRDVKRWKAEWAGKYLLFIPWNFEIHLFPAVERHLNQFRGQLELRPEVQQGRFPWYGLSRYAAVYHEDFELQKIVYPDIAQFPRFALDDTGAYLDCTMFMIPVNKRPWLLGVLVSNVVHAFMNQIMPSIIGGSYRFKSIYMEQLPIPTPTPEQAARLAEFTDDSRLDELNALVYELYGLHAGEIALIEELTAGAYGAAGGAVGEEDAAE